MNIYLNLEWHRGAKQHFLGPKDDGLVQQVFDEIGIDLGDEMGAVPTGMGAVAQPEPEAADTDDLEARLANLRNG